VPIHRLVAQEREKGINIKLRPSDKVYLRTHGVLLEGASGAAGS
jgi:hypothetical protein